MNPVWVAEGVQEFFGVRYWFDGRYFKRQDEYLHRTVWEVAHGPIPPGWHIHHKNHRTDDNRLRNLIAKPGAEHLSEHGAGRPASERQLAHLAEIRMLAADWHGSPEGLAWHSTNGKKVWAKRSPESWACEQCGKRFEAYRVGRQNRFCSDKCRAAWRRAAGVDDEQRACQICGTTFTVNRYQRNLTCSKSCGAKLREQRKRSP